MEFFGGYHSTPEFIISFFYLLFLRRDRISDTATEPFPGVGFTSWRRFSCFFTGIMDGMVDGMDRIPPSPFFSGNGIWTSGLLF
jgi:hypothetical protein